MAYYNEHLERLGDAYEYDLQIDVDHYEELVQNEDDFGERVPRKMIIDRTNPLEFMREDEFT